MHGTSGGTFDQAASRHQMSTKGEQKPELGEGTRRSGRPSYVAKTNKKKKKEAPEHWGGKLKWLRAPPLRLSPRDTEATHRASAS